jgi:flagellar secretion chaperone FliS
MTMRNRTELSYRIAAADMASPTSLLLAMYDTLAGDLLRAASALRAHQIEQRCAELNHAYSVLGHLESWVDQDGDKLLSSSLIDFYGYLRAKMLEASLKQSAPILEAAVELILQVRATWQQRGSASQETTVAAPHRSIADPIFDSRAALSRSA